jgi:selenocysteine lyase/cysteine desulfurase
MPLPAASPRFLMRRRWPTTPIDLMHTLIDAIAISFYKMFIFGFPTGFGVLVFAQGIGAWCREKAAVARGPWTVVCQWHA